MPTFRVDAQDEGLRIDQWLAQRVAGMSRARAQRLVARGAVRRTGRTVKKGDVLRAGDDLTIELDDERAKPNFALPLAVRFESEALVVVAKPAGQATAPLREGETEALANALVARYPEMAQIGYSPREPGLLHRLDTQTSGLVIAARTEAAFRTLTQALRARALTKRYLAIVSGVLPGEHGEVALTLEPHPTDRRRVRIEGDDRPRHVTTWRVLERYDAWTLVEATAPRAYRHQVRAHLAFLGCPIAGDSVYGGQPAPALGHRHALHASYVAWAGTRELTGFEVAEPLPLEMATLLGKAGSREPG